MSSPLDLAGAARLPAAGLAALAGVRCRPDVAVVVSGDVAWVTWPPGAAEVWRPLLAVAGVAFFVERDGRWYRLGQRLPTFDVPPPGAAKPLDRVLFPAPVAAEPPPAFAGTPVRLRLVPCDVVRPTTMLRATLADLAAWADSATTAALAACRAARLGDAALVRGDRLPPLRGERFWGSRVLVPLGRRPEPDLPESALRAAAEVSLGELLLLTDAGAEAIPEAAFEPLTRAGVRLAGHRFDT